MESPLVYYRGYTRSYLDGTSQDAQTTLDQLSDSIDESFKDVDILLIDGVGYPAVGSICGTSNSDVCGALRASSLVLCPTGVGHAVDTYDMCSSYLLHKGVGVLGCVVNNVEREGFYAIDQGENIFFECVCVCKRLIVHAVFPSFLPSFLPPIRSLQLCLTYSNLIAPLPVIPSQSQSSGKVRRRGPEKHGPQALGCTSQVCSTSGY